MFQLCYPLVHGHTAYILDKRVHGHTACILDKKVHGHTACILDYFTKNICI